MRRNLSIACVSLGASYSSFVAWLCPSLPARETFVLYLVQRLNFERTFGC
jgi:hypothetical protein